MKKLFLFLFFLMILGCSSDDNQCEAYKDITNSIQKVTFCGEMNDFSLKHPEKDNFFLHLVKDKETLNSLFSFGCDTVTSIDFQKYDLIIGFEPYANNQYKFYKKCDENKFILEITSKISDKPEVLQMYGYSFLVGKGVVKSKEEITVSNVIVKEKS